MRILVDVRSLQSRQNTGVENYVQNLVEYMLQLDRVNQYLFFYNGLKKFIPPDDLHFVNSEDVISSYPNKLLNIGMRWFNYPQLEKLSPSFETIFLPNPAVINYQPGKRLAVVAHDLSPLALPETFDTQRRIWHWMIGIKQLFLKADLVFSVSEFTKYDLVERIGVPEHKIITAYPALPTTLPISTVNVHQLRDARSRLGLPGEYILFLSTIEPRKNVTTLIDAFEKLQHPAHLVVVGRPGWKYNNIFSRMQKSTKRNKILYLNYVSESDKMAIIKLARAVVYPSLYEGFGLVPLEAMSLGTPVVASSVSAIPEACGSAAVLVDPYKVDDLVEGISSVLTDDVLRGSLVYEGYNQVKKFSWKKTAEIVLIGLQTLQ